MPNIPDQQVDLLPTLLPGRKTGTAVPAFVGFADKANDEEEGKDIKYLDSYQDFIRSYSTTPVQNTVENYLARAVRLYFDNGGSGCYVASVPVNKNNDHNSLLNGPLWEKIEALPDITLIAMPDSLRYNASNAFMALNTRLLQLVTRRPDVFALLDMPLSAIDGATGNYNNEFIGPVTLLRGMPGAERAALYWPPLHTNYSDVGPHCAASGAVAACIAFTDRTKGVWKAPANVPLQQVISPLGEILKATQPEGLNLIRSFRGQGCRIWGCQVLSASRPVTPLHYVQGRRMFSYIETSLKEIARFMVFEPNNEITWFKFKGVARAWLNQVWRAGGLAGTEESEAYQIYLGTGETMTQDDIRSGKLIVRIRVALLMPSEFFDVKMVMNLTGIYAGTQERNQSSHGSVS